MHGSQCVQVSNHPDLSQIVGAEIVKIGNAGAKNGEDWDCEDVFGKVRHPANAGDQVLTLTKKKRMIRRGKKFGR